MPMVYCQLFSGEKLLTDHLLVSIEREVRPNEKVARGGTFRVPEDQLKTIRADQEMRLEFREFEILEISLRADGRVLALLAVKPLN